MIFHLDLDAFFASVEEKYYPEYKNLPIVVGGKSKTGVVGTCNYSARNYGVKKGIPISNALAKCPNLIIINNHRDRYEYWSKKFFNYLIEKYTSQIEIASIDECYMNVNKLVPQFHNNPELLAAIIQKNIYNDLGLSVSIGIAETKEIAKITTNFKKPFGISYTKNDEIQNKIFPLPIEKINGLGKINIPIIKKHGISKIADFVNSQHMFFLQNLLGANYRKIKDGLIGKGHKNIELSNNINKTIEKSYRFDNPEWDEEIIKNQIKEIGKLVLYELKEQQRIGSAISVYLKYKDHLVHKKTKVIKPTNDYHILLEEWIKLFYCLWKNEEPIILIGVGVVKVI